MQSDTSVHEIADGIYRIATPIRFPGRAGGFTFNQYLVVDEAPLLFHTGLRRIFPLVREAVGRVLPVERLRYIGLSHFEAERREEIFDILNDFRTSQVGASRRDAFYPISIYCGRCGKDGTEVLGYAAGLGVVSYRCHTCDLVTEASLPGAAGIKLPWKLDWAMRWRHERISFEPGGKDHATRGGSFDVSSRVARQIFRHEPPCFQPYEFVGIKGTTGKMSSSAGVLFTPAELMNIYEPVHGQSCAASA